MSIEKCKKKKYKCDEIAKIKKNGTKIVFLASLIIFAIPREQRSSSLLNQSLKVHKAFRSSHQLVYFAYTFVNMVILYLVQLIY